MAWVRFTSDFNYRVKHGVVIAYRLGMEMNVPTRCAKEALEIGAAIALHKKSKDAPLTVVSQ